ncbi:MAG: FhaA domain-containing protein [bacterium]
MSLAQRFERRLEGVVGSAFARVFKGQVEPVEIGTALQREATDKKAVMGGGQVFAPNRYRVSLSTSDYERLSPWEQQLCNSLAELVQDHLDERNLVTVGDIEVYLHHDDSLHTGVFGVASRMEADAPPRRRPYDSLSLPVVPGQPPGQYEHPFGAPPAPPTASPGGPAFDPYGNPDPAYAGDRAYAGSQYPPDPYAQARNPADPYAAPGNYPAGAGQYGYPGAPAPASPRGPSPAPPAGYPSAPGDAGGYPAGGYPPGSYPPYPGAPGYPSPGYPGGGYGQQQSPPQYAQPAPPAAPPSPPKVRAALAVDGSDRQLTLRPGSNVIGRGQDCDLQLLDQGVSRRHVDVQFDGQYAVAYDLGSTNGTTVNGHDVASQQLQHGDVIRVGHTRLVFQQDAG